MKSEAVGALLSSNIGKVPLYPGDVTVTLRGRGRGCDRRQRWTSFTDTVADICIYFPLHWSETHTSQRACEKSGGGGGGGGGCQTGDRKPLSSYFSLPLSHADRTSLLFLAFTHMFI